MFVKYIVEEYGSELLVESPMKVTYYGCSRDYIALYTIENKGETFRALVFAYKDGNTYRFTWFEAN